MALAPLYFSEILPGEMLDTEEREGVAHARVKKGGSGVGGHGQGERPLCDKLGDAHMRQRLKSLRHISHAPCALHGREA